MSVLKREEEAPEVFREAILYREWGYRLTNLGKCSLAIDYFERSSKLADAEALRTLIGFCSALIKCMRYFAAEKLSEKCMKLGTRQRHKYVNIKQHKCQVNFSFYTLFTIRKGEYCNYSQHY